MIPRSLREIMAQMQEETRKQFGDEFHVSESSDWYRENMPLAIQLKVLEDKRLDSEANMILATAKDPYFFATASNYLFYRKLPTKAKGWVKTTDSTLGATAKKGEIKLKKVGTDLIYSNIYNLKVTSNEFEFEIESLLPGIISNADTGEIFNIISAPQNWGKFINTSLIAGGQDLETLEEARKRFFNNGYSRSFWNIKGIEAELLRVDGVKSVFAKANSSDEVVESQPRRSLWCVVDGGRDREVAEAIFSKTVDAVLTIGSTTVICNDLNGNGIPINFDRPTELKIDVKVEVLGQTETSGIKNYVIDYLKTVSVGGVVSSSTSQSFIPNFKDYKNIDITFKKSGSVNWVSYIALGNTEKAVYGGL